MVSAVLVTPEHPRPPLLPPCDFSFLLSQFQFFKPPARALAAETLKLERTLSDLVNMDIDAGCG